MLKTNNIDIGKEITTVGTIRTYNKKLYVHTNLCNVNWENEHNNLDCEIYGKVVKANEKFKFYIVECDSTVFIPVRQSEDMRVGQECHIMGYLVERQYTKKNDNTTKSTYEVIV